MGGDGVNPDTVRGDGGDAGLLSLADFVVLIVLFCSRLLISDIFQMQ